jgi:SOS-response transcriptional repressor LexA
VEPRWLATGQAESVGKGSSVEAATIRVPLVSWVAAGMWQDVVDPYPVGEGETMVPVTCRVGPNAYALRVQGDSMEPVFPSGSIIIVDPALEPRQGSYVVVRLDAAEQATFKQLVIDGGTHYLKPLNPRYPLLQIRESATLCGVVRQMVMDFE